MIARLYKPLALVAVVAIGAAAMAEDTSTSKNSNWNQWRGPNGDGVAINATPPTTWSETENLKWKVEIPGKGLATPIIWEDKIIVMTAVETDKTAEEAPEAAEQFPVSLQDGGQDRQDRQGRGGQRRGGQRRGGQGRQGRGGRGGSGTPTNYHEFQVICLDRATGSQVWQKTVAEAIPHEGGHPTNTFASGSPITNGEHIYANFGSFGVYCLDMDGNVKWKRDLGKMETRNSFGEGGSPALHGNTLVVNWDHEGQSFIEALDASTGDTQWKVDRDEPTTWATPLVVEHAGKTQVITNGTNRVRSYDLENGELIWECGGQAANPIPTPMVLDGVAYCMTGYRGFATYAIRLDAKGDVTDSDKVLWSNERIGPYVASAVLYKGNLYVTKGREAILAILDARTGETLLEETRIPGLDALYSSLVAGDDKIYVTGRNGTTVVLKHGAEFEVLATNKLDEGVDASLAIVDNQVFVRGLKHLYCFEN